MKTTKTKTPAKSPARTTSKPAPKTTVKKPVKKTAPPRKTVAPKAEPVVITPVAPPPEPERPRNVKEMRILRIDGKVQGVGYRFFATRVARRLGLKGTIQNVRDGSVEAVVEGEASAIDDWIRELREGPRFAEVTGIDQQIRPFTGTLPDFDVRF